MYFYIIIYYISFPLLQYESNSMVDFTRCNLLSNENILNEKIKVLEQEIIKEKNNNKLLIEKIERLEKLINTKGEINIKDKQNINKINEEYSLFNELNNNLNKINTDFNINKNDKNNILEEITIKDKIIQNNPNQLLEGEKLLSVVFMSVDQKVNYTCICKNTDKFNIIENILYEKYPEYLESDNNFYINGNKINKYKSLEFNKIKNNDIIILKKSEETINK